MAIEWLKGYAELSHRHKNFRISANNIETNEEFKEVFWLTERFVSTVRKLSYFDNLENHRTKILLTFDSIALS